MFSELFTINYNSKKFLVLTDEKHIKTFLEIDDSGNLLYPDIEDYKKLYNIYNVDNLVDYKLSFDQKVRNKSKLISIILAADVFIGSAVGFALSRNEDYVEVVDEIVETAGKRKIVTNYTSVVEDILGEEVVTEEKVLEAIENNKNMGPRYKDLAKKLLDTIMYVEPNFNLRLFYENMLTLKIKVFDEEEKEQYHFRTSYDVKENIMYIQKGSDDPTVCHELMHATRGFYKITDREVLIVHDKLGESLNEAVVDAMIGEIYSNYNGSYYEQRLLKYLLDDEVIDFEQYSNYGVNYLIDDFKMKYSGVDINYIIDYYDAKKVTNSRIGDTIRLENNKKICDELFLVCLQKVDPVDPYASFRSFLELLANFNSETHGYYQNQYEKFLAQQGILNVYSGELEIINAKVEEPKDIKSL